MRLEVLVLYIVSYVSYSLLIIMVLLSEYPETLQTSVNSLSNIEASK